MDELPDAGFADDVSAWMSFSCDPPSFQEAGDPGFTGDSRLASGIAEGQQTGTGALPETGEDGGLGDFLLDELDLEEGSAFLDQMAMIASTEAPFAAPNVLSVGCSVNLSGCNDLSTVVPSPCFPPGVPQGCLGHLNAIASDTGVSSPASASQSLPSGPTASPSRGGSAGSGMSSHGSAAASREVKEPDAGTGPEANVRLGEGAVSPPRSSASSVSDGGGDCIGSIEKQGQANDSSPSPYSTFQGAAPPYGRMSDLPAPHQASVPFLPQHPAAAMPMFPMGMPGGPMGAPLMYPVLPLGRPMARRQRKGTGGASKAARSEMKGGESNPGSGGCQQHSGQVKDEPSGSASGIGGAGGLGGGEGAADDVEVKAEPHDWHAGGKKEEWQGGEEKTEHAGLGSESSEDGSGPKDNDLEKRQARLMRNRESAQLSRQRKKFYMEELEGQLRTMSATVAELQTTIAHLTAENVNLRRQLAYMCPPQGGASGQGGPGTPGAPGMGPGGAMGPGGPMPMPMPFGAPPPGMMGFRGCFFAPSSVVPIPKLKNGQPERKRKAAAAAVAQSSAGAAPGPGPAPRAAGSAVGGSIGGATEQGGGCKAVGMPGSDSAAVFKSKKKARPAAPVAARASTAVLALFGLFMLFSPASTPAFSPSSPSSFSALGSSMVSLSSWNPWFSHASSSGWPFWKGSKVPYGHHEGRVLLSSDSSAVNSTRYGVRGDRPGGGSSPQAALGTPSWWSGLSSGPATLGKQGNCGACGHGPRQTDYVAHEPKGGPMAASNSSHPVTVLPTTLVLAGKVGPVRIDGDLIIRAVVAGNEAAAQQKSGTPLVHPQQHQRQGHTEASGLSLTPEKKNSELVPGEPAESGGAASRASLAVDHGLALSKAGAEHSGYTRGAEGPADQGTATTTALQPLQPLQGGKGAFGFPSKGGVATALQLSQLKWMAVEAMGGHSGVPAGSGSRMWSLPPSEAQGKSGSTDGGFFSGWKGSLVGSEMCTEVFQFDISRYQPGTPAENRTASKKSAAEKARGGMRQLAEEAEDKTATGSDAGQDWKGSGHTSGVPPLPPIRHASLFGPRRLGRRRWPMPPPPSSSSSSSSSSTADSLAPISDEETSLVPAFATQNHGGIVPLAEVHRGIPQGAPGQTPHDSTSVVVSVLAGVEGENVFGAASGAPRDGHASLSKIFVVVLVNGVKYITYACLLPTLSAKAGASLVPL